MHSKRLDCILEFCGTILAIALGVGFVAMVFGIVREIWSR